MQQEIIAAIEAILFATGEPVSIKELSEALDISVSETRESLDEMSKLYDSRDRGIQLIRLNTKYQLCTKGEYHNYIDSIIIKKVNTRLSQAGLETLAIIAYKQPITRVEIESLRGVKSSSSVQTLLDRDLIKESGRLDVPGKPILYSTTSEFLKYAGISSLDELPRYETFVEKIEDKKADGSEDKFEQLKLY